jgi:PIN domain nuclease of toxin-antitoxin system
LTGYLLDTHTLIWWFEGSHRLGKAAKERLSEQGAAIFVSAASAFEISTKHRLGKLSEVDDLLDGYADHLAGQGFHELPIAAAHALHAGALSIEHRDPFDRMLIAQAQLEGLSLVSNERLFDRFGVNRIWD